MDNVTVVGEVPRFVAEIVKVFMGIGVLVEELLSPVISPAIYNLYLAEDLIFTVIVFKASELEKSDKLLNVKVVVPLTVMLFLLLVPALKQGDGIAGSVCV